MRPIATFRLAYLLTLASICTSEAAFALPPQPTATCMAITAVQGVAITPVKMVGSGGAGGPYKFCMAGAAGGRGDRRSRHHLGHADCERVRRLHGDSDGFSEQYEHSELSARALHDEPKYGGSRQDLYDSRPSGRL